VNAAGTAPGRGEIDVREPGDRRAGCCGATLVIGGRTAAVHLGRRT
jgi:hypothetical protein